MKVIHSKARRVTKRVIRGDRCELWELRPGRLFGKTHWERRGATSVEANMRARWLDATARGES